MRDADVVRDGVRDIDVVREGVRDAGREELTESLVRGRIGD
ncbi:hypothetical protein [Streptomyces sp. NBC_00203]